MVDADWIERVAKIIVQLGMSAAFAIVLLWFVLTKVTAALDGVVSEMHRQTETLIDIEKHVIERDQQLFDYRWQQRQRGKE